MCRHDTVSMRASQPDNEATSNAASQVLHSLGISFIAVLAQLLLALHDADTAKTVVAISQRIRLATIRLGGPVGRRVPMCRAVLAIAALLCAGAGGDYRAVAADMPVKARPA